MTAATQTAARAAQVYDKDPGTHTDADFAFLEAIGRADNEWHEALRSANLSFGGGSVAWEAVKRLATRQRNADYASALAVFEADSDIEMLEAAE